MPCDGAGGNITTENTGLRFVIYPCLLLLTQGHATLGSFWLSFSEARFYSLAEGGARAKDTLFDFPRDYR
jgi:hypothetical protein